MRNARGKGEKGLVAERSCAIEDERRERGKAFGTERLCGKRSRKKEKESENCVLRSHVQ